MERYKELAMLRCFSHKDVVQLVGSESGATWLIMNYLQKGYIERVRRDLYVVISMETGQIIPNRYQIASRVAMMPVCLTTAPLSFMDMLIRFFITCISLRKSAFARFPMTM